MQDQYWTRELKCLAEIISELPLEKTVKWGSDVYTYNGKNVVSFAGFKNHFALWFFKGVFLKDHKKVLINTGEGKTKSLRQWRFTSGEEIDAATIKAYVLEAIEAEKQGLKIKPEKHQPVTTIPLLLSNALKKDAAFNKAFKILTSGKQKEYCLYINEAKQEATKLKRLEKIKPLVLEGKGLYDKYKNC
jgi:uncharacterized protein YdeI (YjbR/CyaY-like superfamily)